MKIDTKDRKILYQLDLNARQSFSQIGKKVGLSKNTVAYRVNKLEEDGIIKGYYTVIDCFKLGYASLRFYLTLQYTTPEIKKEIIDYFINDKYTYFIGSIEGRYDLVIIMWVKQFQKFHSFWQETLKRYRDYFQQQMFSSYIQLLHYPDSWLLKDAPAADRNHFQVIGRGVEVDVEPFDVEVLKLIGANARMPLTDIAKELGESSSKVNYHLKKMRDQNVIRGFRVALDISKLDYKQFKVDIDFKDYSKINEITDYLIANPHLFYITRTAGHADLEPTLRVQGICQLHEILNDLTETFPGAIKNYQYFYITKMHKLNYMPGCEYV